MTATMQRPVSSPAAAPQGAPDDELTPWLSVVAVVVAFALPVATAAGGPSWLRALLVTGFFVFTVGAAPWVLVRGLGNTERLTAATGTGLAVGVLVSVGMLNGHAWHPTAAALVLGLAAVVLHLRYLVLNRKSLSLNPFRWDVDWPAPALVGAGTVVWTAACLRHLSTDPGHWGLLAFVGPLWFVGIALLVAGFIVARSRGGNGVLAVLALCVAMTVTPVLVYDGARSQSAVKHIQLIQVIRDVHEARTSIDAYSSWPGFFSLLAMFCDLAGVSDPSKVAQLWPLAVGFFRIGAIRTLAGRFVSAPTAWLAALLFLIVEATGVDYFSPQALAYPMAFLTVAFALRRWPAAGAGILIGLLSCATAVTHQLTPLILAGLLVLLAVLRQLPQWWTALIAVAVTAAWTGMHFGVVLAHTSTKLFGDLDNLAPPPTRVAPGLYRLPVVAAQSYALTAGIIVLGMIALVAVLRGRRSPRTWALAAAPGVALGLVMLNSYGQEGIFRAAAFGVPWLAILAAMTLADFQERTRLLAASAAVALLTPLSLVAAFAMDGSTQTRFSEAGAYHRFVQLAATDRPSVLLQLGSGDQPTYEARTTRNAARAAQGLPPATNSIMMLGRRPLEESVRGLEPVDERDLGDAELVGRITSDLRRYLGKDGRDADLFVVWTPSMRNHGEEYGIRSPEQSSQLRDAFLRDRQWSVVHEDRGTYLLRRTGDPQPKP